MNDKYFVILAAIVAFSPAFYFLFVYLFNLYRKGKTKEKDIQNAAITRVSINERNNEAIQIYDKAIESILNMDKNKYFDDAIKINPQFSDALSIKGLLLLSKGEPDKAIKALDEAIRINPKSAIALNNKGISLGMDGNYTGAIEYFNKAIDIDSLYVQAYYNKGIALEKSFKPFKKGWWEKYTKDYHEIQTHINHFGSRILCYLLALFSRLRTRPKKAIRTNQQYAVNSWVHRNLELLPTGWSGKPHLKSQKNWWS